MKVSDCMSARVDIARREDTMSDVARVMRQSEVGFMPVCDGVNLVGTITDRDMVVRGLADEKGPDTVVSEIMSEELIYCFDDEELDDAAAKMSDNQIRRLPVLSREMRVVGVISLGDIAQASDDDGSRASETFSNVTEAGGRHAQ